MKTCADPSTMIRPPSWCSSAGSDPKRNSMLNQQTIDKLHTMKLHGIADAFRAQLETTEVNLLCFEERFALLVDQQWLWKEKRALARRLRAAHMKARGVIEDVDYLQPH